MYRTVQIAGLITAQGVFVRHLVDGRVVIDVGDRLVAGTPITR